MLRLKTHVIALVLTGGFLAACTTAEHVTLTGTQGFALSDCNTFRACNDR